MLNNKALYLVEIINLMNGLIEKGISFKFKTIYDGYQVIVYDKNNERDWDAVCHYFSYGHKSGLLEIYGSIVNKNVGDSVEGFLTANDILRRL